MRGVTIYFNSEELNLLYESITLFEQYEEFSEEQMKALERIKDKLIKAGGDIS